MSAAGTTEIRVGETSAAQHGLNSAFRADAPWLLVMASATALEIAWWAVIRVMGIAPAPFLLIYLALAFAGMGLALALRAMLLPRDPAPNAWSMILGTTMVGLGASFFLPLKYAIPGLVPFWLDGPLAHAERLLFTTDPWLLLDRCLGWALVPMDRLYGLWLPTQALVLFFVMMQPPSAAKSRLLIAYVLGWFVLGIAAATIFSSAGPLFYDRAFGGTAFASLRDTLNDGGAWIALRESDQMWESLQVARPSIVEGISAFPSIHVAISLWIFLAARAIAPRAAAFALVYAILIWVGSVQLGWHYAADGLAAVLGMLLIWRLSGRIDSMVSATISRRVQN